MWTIELDVQMDTEELQSLESHVISWDYKDTLKFL